MFEKADITKKDVVRLGIDEQAMAKGYMEMGAINLELTEEMYHWETEATYTTEEFVGDKK